MGVLKVYTGTEWKKVGCGGGGSPGMLKIWDGTQWLRERCLNETVPARPMKIYDGTTWVDAVCFWDGIATTAKDVVDNYNRADTTAGSLGTRSDGGIYDRHGSWYVESNQGRNPATPLTGIEFAARMGKGNVDAEVTIYGNTNFPTSQFMVRAQSTGNSITGIAAQNIVTPAAGTGYCAKFLANGSASKVEIWRNGVQQQVSADFSLGVAGTNAPLGGVLTLDVVADVVTVTLLWANNTLKTVTWTDPVPLTEPSIPYMAFKADPQPGGNASAYTMVDNLSVIAASYA